MRDIMSVPTGAHQFRPAAHRFRPVHINSDPPHINSDPRTSVLICVCHFKLVQIEFRCCTTGIIVAEFAW